MSTPTGAKTMTTKTCCCYAYTLQRRGFADVVRWFTCSVCRALGR